MAGKRTFAPWTFSAWTFASGHWVGTGTGVAFAPVLHYHTLEGPSQELRQLTGPAKVLHTLEGPSQRLRILKGSN